MANTKTACGGGVSFATVLVAIFFVLKVTGTITWGWFWVFSPWIFSIGLVLFILVLFAIIAVSAAFLDR